MGRIRKGKLKQMWINIDNCRLEDIGDMGFISLGAPRKRHQDKIKGFILLEEMAMRKQIEKEPERLGEYHSKCKSDPQ